MLVTLFNSISILKNLILHLLFFFMFLLLSVAYILDRGLDLPFPFFVIFTFIYEPTLILTFSLLFVLERCIWKRSICGRCTRYDTTTAVSFMGYGI